MMNIQFIFTLFLALDLLGNFYPAPGLTLLKIDTWLMYIFMLQVLEKQIGSYPRRQTCLEQKGVPLTFFVLMVLQLRFLLIYIGFDNIQTSHWNLFSTEGGDTLEKEMPVLPKKGFIQRVQQIQRICSLETWHFQTLLYITVHLREWHKDNRTQGSYTRTPGHQRKETVAQVTTFKKKFCKNPNGS